MYQSFTGSSRRPRQVDLSGRRANPFAPVASQGGPSSALQNAQHERQVRQDQRRRLAAAKNIQRVWRGHASRQRSRQEWRVNWDRTYGGGGAAAFASEAEAAEATRLLLIFARANDDRDRRRIEWHLDRLHRTIGTGSLWQSPTWTSYYLRLELLSLQAMQSLSRKQDSSDQINQFLGYVKVFAITLGTLFGDTAHIYFKTMSVIYAQAQALRGEVLAATRMLLAANRKDLVTCTAFVSQTLVKPLESDTLKVLSTDVDMGTLFEAADTISAQKLDSLESLWLLSQLVFIASQQRQRHARTTDDIDSRYIHVIGRLLPMVGKLVDLDQEPVEFSNEVFNSKILSAAMAQRSPPNTFVKTTLLTLIDQDTIRRVLSSFQHSSSGRSTELATYVLTLLRVFPAHADDIRMWLYLGAPERNDQGQSISPVAYFWREARSTSVVRSIIQSARSAIDLIINKHSQMQWQAPGSVDRSDAVAEEWKVVLIFLELYTFVLKLMDDEEFLGHEKSETNMRNNPLTLPEVADLVIFLKHLGFALYYHAKHLIEDGEANQDALRKPNLMRQFSTPANTSSISSDNVKSPIKEAHAVAGVPGITVEYVKRLVTGLVRSIYERDSRRKFLPKDQWLMTSEFDMSSFISDVVSEEESRHQVQDMEDEDGDDSMDDKTDDWSSPNLNSHMQRIANVERQQRLLRKASRKRYLASVAPRLEILQHMPFLIPFDTRVKIFREFVHLDQKKRRYGQTDPDLWRHTLFARSRTQQEAEHQLSRQHAKVRRKHEFEDAMDQFFDLGADLKQPIQITFVDEFDIVEAGIDGGGVTKEFLTSATSEAFGPGKNLFETNRQHLLYPKPTAMDEVREHFALRRHVSSDKSLPESLQHLLNMYEFAGRLVGKCLYEGILIDVSFAGFFLLKWALAGTSGINSKDGGYRASINDVRDLDEGLYQGLISLKNYQGDVSELALTFSVTDEIPLGDGKFKTIERELIPGGADTAVTNENRLVYISRIARYRLQTQAAAQTNAFLTGLSTIIRPSWLSMFNQSETQNLVGGATSGIDVDDLRRNTIYGGVYVIGDDGQEHPTVQLFWRLVKELPNEDKGKVLKFVTSTPRAPLLGFASLLPKFSIRDSGEDEARFPTTSTCINLLKLPRYKSKEVLQEKLLYAINSGAGFDLS